jgi:hypothetical protein
MSSERIPCKNPDCRSTILPATAKANDGLCAPCIGKIRKAEWDEYVRQNRRTVNLYESVTDPVEIIRIMLTHRKHDPLIEYAPPPISTEHVFTWLSTDQQRRLSTLAAEAVAAGETDFGQDIAKSLATLTETNLDEMLQCWLDHGNLWPSVAFRKAGASVRDRILEQIAAGSANLNHALRALAWIGDSVVVKKFAEWEKSPPVWRSHLRVGLGAYALEGGWELTKSGRRNLYFDECYALEIVSDDTPASEVRLLNETGEKCPLCGDPLVHLLEIPMRGGPLGFLRFAGASLPVLTCERCTCWNMFAFARVGVAGDAKWHHANPDSVPQHSLGFEFGRGPWHGKRVALKQRPAIHAVDWCMQLSSSQIGGMPTWVQSPAYPGCPDCDRAMMFLAQIDNSAFSGHEGTYYAFICGDCRVTATTYQQT